MRPGGMEGQYPEQTPATEDLDEIDTLMNLLELRTRLRSETSRFENELE